MFNLSNTKALEDRVIELSRFTRELSEAVVTMRREVAAMQAASDAKVTQAVLDMTGKLEAVMAGDVRFARMLQGLERLEKNIQTTNTVSMQRMDELAQRVETFEIRLKWFMDNDKTHQLLRDRNDELLKDNESKMQWINRIQEVRRAGYEVEDEVADLILKALTGEFQTVKQLQEHLPWKGKLGAIRIRRRLVRLGRDEEAIVVKRGLVWYAKQAPEERNAGV